MKRKELNIKIFKQETSKSCGVACLRSILNYYGKNLSEKDIWKKHNPYITKNGPRNPIISLGLTALKFGFRVKYVGYNPIIVSNNSNPKYLQASLKIKSKKNKKIEKYYIDTALKFLELGGELIIDRLNIKKLKKIIDENNFFLVEIKPAFFWKNIPLDANHKVIVIGYDKEHFKMLNPSNGQEWLIKFDSFMMAFYAAMPEILIVKSPKI